MNATQTRLNNMTVAQLRIIGRESRLSGLSGLRKAALVNALAVWIDGCHIDALAMDAAYSMSNALGTLTASHTTVSLMDYPAVDGRVVTEAHARICAERGCVSYVKNGVEQGMCPRCGEITTSEEQIEAEEIDRTMIVHFGSLISGVSCNATDAQISDPDMAEVTCEECKIKAAHEEALYEDLKRETSKRIRRQMIEVAHEEALTEDKLRFPVLKNDSEEKGFFPNGDPRNYDSLNAIAEMIPALRDIAAKALAACEATITGPVRDMHYQAHQDAQRAADEMTRTLAWFDMAESA